MRWILYCCRVARGYSMLKDILKLSMISSRIPIQQCLLQPPRTAQLRFVTKKPIDLKWQASCGSDLHLNSKTRRPTLVVKNPHSCSNPKPNKPKAVSYYSIWNAVSETLFLKIFMSCAFGTWLPPVVINDLSGWLALLSLKLGVYGNIFAKNLDLMSDRCFSFSFLIQTVWSIWKHIRLSDQWIQHRCLVLNTM